jgi:hypothetical protein
LEQERNLINVPNAEGKEGGSNANSSYGVPKFDPEEPTGSTLIMLVLFLYPEYATSDVITDFLEGTLFAAILALIFRLVPSAVVRCRWEICRRIARRVRDDDAEEPVGGQD